MIETTKRKIKELSNLKKMVKLGHEPTEATGSIKCDKCRRLWPDAEFVVFHKIKCK